MSASIGSSHGSRRRKPSHVRRNSWDSKHSFSGDAVSLGSLGSDMGSSFYDSSVDLSHDGTTTVLTEEESRATGGKGKKRRHSSHASLAPSDLDAIPGPGQFYQSIFNQGAGDKVACVKMIVILMLTMAAFIIGNSVFIFSVYELDEDYSNEFSIFATELLEGSHRQLHYIAKSTTGHKNNIISRCQNVDCPWPFVTIPLFEKRHHQYLSLAKAEEVTLFPVVMEEDRIDWEVYSRAHQGWVQEGVNARGLTSITPEEITPYIHLGSTRDPGREDDPYYLPHWQVAPAPVDPENVNWNAYADDTFRDAFDLMAENRLPTVSRAVFRSVEDDNAENEEGPNVLFLQPITSAFDPNSNLMGGLVTKLKLGSLFGRILPKEAHDMIVVLENSCGQNFTYSVSGHDVTYLGEGDLHDIRLDEIQESSTFETSTTIDTFRNGTLTIISSCQYDATVYPSEEFRSSYYATNTPLIYTSIVMVVMTLTICLFCIYDFCAEKRSDDLATDAARSNALVSSLFPEQVKNRLLESNKLNESRHGGGRGGTSSGKVKGVGKGDPNKIVDPDDQIERPDFLDSKPIAEIFLNTTIMFGDICGFNAWSSVREPSQVFVLLETIYNSFDIIAQRRGVFKVETIGDCYVAVTGIPDPRSDHATAMVRFAHTCIQQLDALVVELEKTLGPDTGDLSLRVGLHSGPVTGGVLRGEKSRFQLFGDTMNTAARMQTTGAKRRVHLSQDTANALEAAGKGNWVQKREGKVHAKGKGRLQTYWLNFSLNKKGSQTPNNIQQPECSPESSSSPSRTIDKSLKGTEEISLIDTVLAMPIEAIQQRLDDKSRKLVGWMVELLLRPLKQISAMRDDGVEFDAEERRNSLTEISEGALAVDECKDIIALPTCVANFQRDPVSVKISEETKAALTDYVTRIAAMYRSNPFHCFEHATHVTMSVSKLLSRITSNDDVGYDDMTMDQKKKHARLHRQTFGITSDPLTQFCITLSALVHDVDHPGVPNSQLIKEQNHLVDTYKTKCIAEQNSFNVAWDLLMDVRYEPLIAILCSNEAEGKRFRQLIVNSVIATDLFDEELRNEKKKRWEKDFALPADRDEDPRDTLNRKATIVIEHLMQASDIAHTMQHWHVYKKWNEKFFRECYNSYKEGRCDTDPSETWYEEELAFFDEYVIPLVSSLKECGVFGVSSDEFVNYAKSNRKEWEKKGKEIVATYLTRFNKQRIQKPKDIRK